MAMTKEELHRLIEDLPEKDLQGIGQVLALLAEKQRQARIDKMLAEAPIDDEPWTEEDEAAYKAGKEDVAAGRTIPWEQLQKELGLM